MRCLNCGNEILEPSITTCPKCHVNLASLMGEALAPGTLLDRKYTIEYPLSRGGFGITYCAQHNRTEQKLAIKEFYPREYAVRETTSGTLTVLESSQITYERGMRRFLKEARTLAKLNHPNIVRVQDFFEERGSAYIVMELIKGRTLRQELNSQPNKRLSPDKVRELMSALVEALAEIHRASIYHLDLKPENILITSKGRVVLVDFGAAKQGMSKGTTRAFTLDYAAPEVISGDRVGSYSDLFELGMLLYEMLTGNKPPTAMSRFLNNNWQPTELEQPWQDLIVEALKLQKEDRPTNVKDWWYRFFPSESENSSLIALSNPRSESDSKSPSPPSRSPSFSISTDKYAQNNSIARNSQSSPQRNSQISRSQTNTNSSRFITLELQEFQFETATLKKRGSWFNINPTISIERRQSTTTYFIEDLGEGIILETINIPGGSFMMGAKETEKDSHDDERPQHEVIVSPFLIGKFPVTQAQWRIVAGMKSVDRSLDPDPAHFKGDNFPVENVSWYDAIEFCRRLCQATGRNYRLPSEAEWEYACRAGTDTPFYYGETLTNELANYDATITYAFEPPGESRETTTPVGSFPPNAFGLYDMHGNIWEWCADTWHDNYLEAPNDSRPWIGGDLDNFSPMRGGTWSLDAASCRSANRLKLNRIIEYKYFGFRVVLDVIRS